MKNTQLFIFFCILLLTFFSCKKDDPCEGVVCLNGGTCAEGLGTCQCQNGYEGDSCETFILQSFLGVYNVTYQGCFTTSPDHTVAIDQASGNNQINIFDLGDYECPGGRIEIVAEVDATNVTIPAQTIDCSGEIAYTFSGSGSLSNNILTLNFKVSYDADGVQRQDDCTATLEK